jgi:hypothetical protein
MWLNNIQQLHLHAHAAFVNYRENHDQIANTVLGRRFHNARED